MAGINHLRTSVPADTADPSLIQPSDYVADHTITGTVDMGVHTLKANTIAEAVAAAGVTIDGLLIKDTTVTANGIIFPATQVPSAGANTLDDYEEGTWTPTITAGTGTPTAVYSTQVGTYTKKGREVTIHAHLVTSTWTHTATGQLRLSGLPFAPAMSECIGPVGEGGWTLNTGLGSGPATIIARTAAGETFLIFGIPTIGATSGLVTPPITMLASGTQQTLIVTLTYYTA